MGVLDYKWVPWVSGFFAFLASVGMGGNDVSNSFATSVGARALTVKQVILIASICEFSGAMLMGSEVTETIKGKIINMEYYVNQPEELMFGMLTVLIGCGFWLILATWLSLPVSSTHTCIGGMLGMAIISKGVKAVQWRVVINVLLSWFYTPVVAGIVSISLFYFVRRFVLLKDDSFQRSLSFFSPMFGATLFMTVFVLTCGGSRFIRVAFTWWQSILISLGISTLIALLVYFFMLPCIQKRGEIAATPVPQNDTEQALIEEKEVKHDVFAGMKDEKIAEMHESAEVYHKSTEQVFIYLQVLAAILNSFAHGANDVSHSIGPFAACIAIYTTGGVHDQSPCPAWILAFGAAGIILGLATMGYRVMATMGVNLVTVTPCRGFFIEFASSLVVLIGSKLGAPLSTTQCKVGAAVGVGLIGGKKSVNWKLLLSIFFGWIATIFVAAIVSALLMGYGIYAPKA